MIQHHPEEIQRTRLLDAVLGRTSLQRSMAPVPEGWRYRHGICLGIEQTSCRLQREHNLDLTFSTVNTRRWPLRE